MTESVQPDTDALCAEILAGAKRESEEILRRARSEAEAILAAGAAEAEKIRREQREQAQAASARRKDVMLASVAADSVRLRAARIEALLDGVRQVVRRRLAVREFDARESVVALATEALGRMHGNDFVLKIAPDTLSALGEGWADEVVRQARRPALKLAVVADTALADDGVIIESADGFQLWDNRLLARLERMWPELRRQIALHASLIEATPQPEQRHESG